MQGESDGGTKVSQEEHKGKSKLYENHVGLQQWKI